MELENLYEQLNILATDDFEQIEPTFFLKLHSIPDEIKPQSVVVFWNISTWQGTSVQSGVWTFYVTLQYLVQTGQTELADVFSRGIHDYQNPKYALNYNYPDAWMEESDVIDD